MDTVYILPTGDEIKSGIVLDQDSPEIIRQLLQVFPAAQITRLPPLIDHEETILAEISRLCANAPDLIVIIGGSGGGHRHSASLGKDFTHSALERFLEQQSTREIYGKNGHLWCKLLCGQKQATLIINVPGPFVEATAAMEAFLATFSSAASADAGIDLAAINQAMADAVLAQYPSETAAQQ